MSKEIAEEIQKALAFIEQGERLLNVTLLKSRHASMNINNALNKIGNAKVYITIAAKRERNAGDTYE